MKKTALTIGLFSLVVLATSFSAPIDGGAAGGIIRKRDVNASEMNSRNLNFASVNQSIGNDKKVD
ncbi:hypothetical protein FLCH110379_16305 [Flavobacterium chungbukense]